MRCARAGECREVASFCCNAELGSSRNSACMVPPSGGRIVKPTLAAVRRIASLVTSISAQISSSFSSRPIWTRRRRSSVPRAVALPLVGDEDREFRVRCRVRTWTAARPRR